MKNAIEARRPEAYTAKPDEDLDSPDAEVCIYVCISVHPKKVSKKSVQASKAFQKPTSPVFQYGKWKNSEILFVMNRSVAFPCNYQDKSLGQAHKQLCSLSSENCQDYTISSPTSVSSDEPKTAASRLASNNKACTWVDFYVLLTPAVWWTACNWRQEEPPTVLKKHECSRLL